MSRFSARFCLLGVNKGGEKYHCQCLLVWTLDIVAVWFQKRALALGYGTGLEDKTLERQCGAKVIGLGSCTLCRALLELALPKYTFLNLFPGCMFGMNLPHLESIPPQLTLWNTPGNFLKMAFALTSSIYLVSSQASLQHNWNGKVLRPV